MSQVEAPPMRLPQRPAAFGLTAETQYDKCVALARNLWWSWHAEVINLFRDLDPIRWRQLDHNPIALLAEFTPERLEMRAAELVLYSRINQAFRRLKEYVGEIPPWGRTHAGVLGSKPVAYFSLEFGVHESVPIYSGGLGVLSGDHIKSASGLGVPLVAIGLFYDQGYFKQHLDINGWQNEEYLDTKVENLPMEPALGTDGKPITVRIDTRQGKLLAKVWLMHVGRVRLYLLDCDVPGNSPEDRELDRPALRRRQPHPHPPGAGGRRGRRAGLERPGHPARRLSSQRRPQRLRHARGHPHADEGRRHELRHRPAGRGPAHRLHHPHARARRPRPLRPQPDRRAPRPLARRAGHLDRAVDGPGPRRAAKRARNLLHDRAGPEALPPGQRREQPPRPHHPADVGPSLALARRGGNPHRTHHQRRPHPELAGLADAAALRPLLPRQLDAPHGRAGRLAGHPRHRSRRAVGDALRPEEPAPGLRPPADQPAVPPPRRERRGRRGRPEHPRPEHPHPRVRPPLRHLQAGGDDPERPRPAGRDGQRPRAARCRSSSPARPIPPTSRANS